MMKEALPTRGPRRSQLSGLSGSGNPRRMMETCPLSALEQADCASIGGAANLAALRWRCFRRWSVGGSLAIRRGHAPDPTGTFRSVGRPSSRIDLSGTVRKKEARGLAVAMMRRALHSERRPLFSPSPAKHAKNKGTICHPRERNSRPARGS